MGASRISGIKVSSGKVARDGNSGTLVVEEGVGDGLIEGEELPDGDDEGDEVGDEEDEVEETLPFTTVALMYWDV